VKAALLAGRQQVALLGDPDGIAEGVLNIAPTPTVAPTTSSAPENRKNRKNRKNKKKGGGGKGKGKR
jgi:hypothetical protein